MKKLLFLITFLYTPLAALPDYFEDYRMEIALQGEWKFEIGDNRDWARPEQSDSNWESITVPAYWENEGFPGYDGFAWYRKRIFIPQRLQGRNLLVYIGRVDDVNECYVNGRFVGRTGEYSPKYVTAWDRRSAYSLPPNSVRFGAQNVIAVRVEDFGTSGGIYGGTPG